MGSIALTCLRRALLSMAFALPVAGAQGNGDATSSKPPSSILPLRREALATQVEPPRLLAGGALAVLAATGTVLLGRRRKWAWLQIGQRSDRGGCQVQRLSSQALTPQASLHAVRWQGEELLIACTAQQVTVLSRRSIVSEESS